MVKKILNPGSGSASNNVVFFIQKIVFELSETCSVMFIPDPDLDFITHPGSRGQKGSGSGPATLALTKLFTEDA